jgi:pilus assembly protein FimV
VVKQYTENQYDDDLTLSNNEYDDSYYTDADDLFEFSTDDESPISRLKSLVLSIDWEITDEVLLQFNEELLDLKGIWAGQTVHLVYVQALEKISKYIYQNKADSHPNAIKLLLTFYYNLEKIVSSQDLTEEQKKEILFEDVKKFENLKRQIKHKPSSEATREPEKPQPQKIKKEGSGEDELLNLKAIVLGIDWEITDQDLNDLRREVLRLEEKFSENRPKLILLQGIGTLAAYIKLKKSNAHPDAFKVMQLFYDSLEKIVQKPMSLESEKAILFPAVEKFNSFKALLGPTIAPDAIIRKDDEGIEEFGTAKIASEISPALADVSEEEELGFQAEKEAMTLGLKDPGGVASHIENFFGESASNHLFDEEVAAEPEKIEESFADNLFTEDMSVDVVEKDLALQGVDVEGDDEEESASETDVLGKESFAPLGFEEMAISDEVIAGISADEPPLKDVVLQQEEEQISTEETIVGATETIFPDDEQEFLELQDENGGLDREKALLGVDVETEADDDTDELSLPMEGEEVAPALASMDEESLYSATSLDRAPISSSVTEEIVGTIDGLFLDHDGISAAPASVELIKEESGVDGGKEEDQDEEPIGFEDWLKEDSKEEEPLPLTVGEESNQDAAKEQVFADVTESEPDDEGGEGDNVLQAATEFTEDQNEDNLNSFFTEDDLEQRAKDGSEIDALFDSLETDLIEERDEEIPVEIPNDLRVVFDSERTGDVSDEELLSVVIPQGTEDAVVEKSESALPSPSDFVDDEVVFELYKEEIEPDAAVEPRDEESSELPGEATWTAHEESKRTIEPELTEPESIKDWVATSTAVAAEVPIIPEPLSGLQMCIDSLQLELSDAIILGLFKEINALRQKLTDKPLEKTFLQLLSTVTQHIDSYRYESSAEAHGLLVSICQALSSMKDNTLHVNQEILLGETHKVLTWQQGMLSRQTVKKGNQLIFADPLRTEKEISSPSDAQKEFDEHLKLYEDSAVDGISAAHGLQDETATQNELIQPAGGVERVETKEMSGTENVEIMRKAFSDDLRKEIAALRQTLQMEIAELRKELKKE